jgi:hypothetical protein
MAPRNPFLGYRTFTWSKGHCYAIYALLCLGSSIVSISGPAMLEYTACKRYYDHTQRAKLEKVTASYADHDNCKAQPVHSGFIFLMTALAVATEAIC